MNPRSEPLLWLQLIALGAMPLELLLLLLLLAGADPGPLPGLERLLVWGLGALAPTLLLWRRPADCCSLLLVQVPAAARSPVQRSLAAAQEALPLKLLLLLGSGVLLPLFWTFDSHAALAGPLSPLESGNRLVSLLLAVPLLAVLLWQWQQLVQSLWLLSRPAAALSALTPLSAQRLASERLSLGIPLLLLNALEPDPAPQTPSSADTTSAEEPQPPEAPEASDQSPDGSAAGETVAVEPEQGDADEQGDDLDQ